MRLTVLGVGFAVLTSMTASSIADTHEGAASKIVALLEKDGYTVEDVILRLYSNDKSVDLLYEVDAVKGGEAVEVLIDEEFKIVKTQPKD